MGWWHSLFGAKPPAEPPENFDTLRLLDEVKRFSNTARTALPDREALASLASEAAWNQGYGDNEPLIALLSDLAEALIDAATFDAIPNELTLQTALKDVLAGVALREQLRDTLVYLRDVKRHHEVLEDVLRDILYEATVTLHVPDGVNFGCAPFRVPLLTYLEDLPDAIGGTIGRLYGTDVRATPLFRRLRDQLTDNISHATERHRVDTLKDLHQKIPDPYAFLATVAHGTPFLDFYSATLPFAIPRQARFEHLHMVAGSGHGKTQCLQLFLLEDLARATEERFGFALLDSQGDLINKLVRLHLFHPDDGPLSDRLILIDPNDLSHPVALNLFDYHLERFQDFDPVEREKIFHGVLELYRYIFSSLLGAELTQKQGVVFTNLARAMLVIPNPTIFTFYDFVEDGSQFRDAIERLDPIPRRFFETQFFTSTYSETRQQIITRLLGILSQPVFEKMFGSEHNRIDLFGAMQDGKIIVVNTAKDLLKAEGSAMFGRFFIALIAQATVARAALRASDRTPFHLYIDEAQEYLDHKTAELFNQGRKYNVGVAVAHQNLDQLTTELRATLHASTAIKLVGGANHKDAVSFAQEMNTSAEFIHSRRKRSHSTEFACFVRHHTPLAVSITVPFGVLERAATMPTPAFMELLQANRARVSGAPKIAHGHTPAAAPEEPTPTEEPEAVSTATLDRKPNPSPRAPKDDLDFYID